MAKQQKPLLPQKNNQKGRTWQWFYTLLQMPGPREERAGLEGAVKFKTEHPNPLLGREH